MIATLPSEPSAAILNLAALSYFLGISVTTWCITHATEKYSLLTRKTWKTITWARVCLLLVLLVTWLYLMITGMLLHGAPREHGSHRCSTGIIICLTLYTTSKALVYLCLIERVRAVWSTTGQRWRSPVYLFCVSLLLPLVGIIAGFSIPQAIHYVYNGYCIVGTNRLSSIFLLTYDICINLFLTGMFVVPLIRATIRSAWLRAVAIRSTIASLIALVTTSVNCGVLYVLDGDEIIWICFGGCAADMVIGTVGLYWALQGPGETCDGAQEVYFSTINIGDIPTFRPGALESTTENQDCPMVSLGPSHQGSTSETTLAVSHVWIPSLEEPKLTMQNLQHQAIFVGEPSQKTLSLSLPVEKPSGSRNIDPRVE